MIRETCKADDYVETSVVIYTRFRFEPSTEEERKLDSEEYDYENYKKHDRPYQH